MKLAGDYVFEAPVDEVWSALMDPEVLAAVMPGCEKLEKDGNVFTGDMNIKVGPVQGKFNGRVELKDVQEPTSYTMIIDGKGVPGFVKATAKITLAPDGTSTKITYDADAQVGGKIASVGQRLIEATSKAIAKQSLDGLHENIKIRSAANKEAAAPEPAAKEPEPSPEPAKKEEEPSAATAMAAVAVAEGATAAEPALAAAAVKDAEEAPAPEVEKAEKPAPVVPAPSTPPPTKKAPEVVLKKVDPNALAAAVAKEAAKSLLPTPVLIGIGVVVVAIVLYFVMRH